MGKTTIDIPDALLAEAKIAARERGTTLRELVNAGLRDQLEAEPGAGSSEWEPLTFSGKPRPGVDLRDWGRIKAIVREDRH